MGCFLCAHPDHPVRFASTPPQRGIGSTPRYLRKTQTKKAVVLIPLQWRGGREADGVVQWAAGRGGQKANSMQLSKNIAVRTTG